jgi:hypothetical protein
VCGAFSPGTAAKDDGASAVGAYSGGTDSVAALDCEGANVGPHVSNQEQLLG